MNNPSTETVIGALTPPRGQRERRARVRERHTPPPEGSPDEGDDTDSQGEEQPQHDERPDDRHWSADDESVAGTRMGTCAPPFHADSTGDSRTTAS